MRTVPASPISPDACTWRKLGDLAEVIRGVAYKKDQVSDAPGGGLIPLLRSGNVKGELRLDGGLVYVPEHLPRNDQILRPGDVVVSVSNSKEQVGKAALLRDEWRGTFGAFLAVVRPTSDEILPDYLGAYFATPGYRRTIAQLSAATNNIANIRKSHLLDLDIPVPALCDQRRVALGIAKNVESVGTGSRLLGEAQESLRSLRRSILERAVAGSWPRVALSETLHQLRNGIFVSRPAANPPGIRIFRISAVRPMSLSISDVRYAPADTERHEKFLLEEGDLLFTRYSGNPNFVGACAAVPRLPAPTIYPDKLIRGVVDRSVASPEFLEIACSAGQTLKEIQSRRKTTAGQVGIAGRQLAAVSVPLPPLAEQSRIAETTRSHLEQVAALEHQVDRAHGQGIQLMRSTFHHAFQGGGSR